MAILCGTDLSPRGGDAADVAAAMAFRSGQALVLAHALESGDAVSAMAELSEEARRLETRYAGLRVEPRLEYGLPDEVLARLAAGGEEGIADVRLVVVSSLGRRRTRWILGSVAERIAQASPVPVLVVREADSLRLWLASERRLRVMIGDDFGDESEAALRWASALSHLAPCDVVAVHLASPVPPAGRGRSRKAAAPAGDEIEVRLLAELRSRVALHTWADGPPRVWVVLAPGKRAPLVAKLAADEHADLVVLGNRQRHGPSLVWQESVSRGVLYHAGMNVACVPVRPATEPESFRAEGAGSGATLELAATLEGHAFLRGVPGDLLDRLATITREEAFPAGALLLREGEEADCLRLILRGKVALEVAMPGKPAYRLETLGGGDIVGLSWLNPPYRWQFDARAVEPVDTLALDAPTLREWMREDPRMAQAVATRLVAHLQRRLERVRLQRLDVYGAEA